MQKVIFLGALFLFTACVPAFAVLRPKISSDTKTIAVISALPQAMNYDAVGVSVFGNGHEAVDLKDWRLNDLALEKASHALQGRFIVETPDVPSNISENPSASEWAAAIGGDAARADLYIIIEAMPFYPKTGVDIGGFNLQKHYSAIRTEPPILGVWLQFTLIDGKTLKVIGTQRGLPKNLPFKELQSFDWKDRWEDLTDGQHRLVQQDVRDLIESSIQDTFEQMQIIQ